MKNVLPMKNLLVEALVVLWLCDWVIFLSVEPIDVTAFKLLYVYYKLIVFYPCRTILAQGNQVYELH